MNRWRKQKGSLAKKGGDQRQNRGQQQSARRPGTLRGGTEMMTSRKTELAAPKSNKFPCGASIKRGKK